MKIKTQSPEETYELGYKIGETLPKDYAVSLNGEIGTGKTTLIKGIASALGLISDNILSPYFNILFEYKRDSDVVLRHFDFMRLKSSSELFDLNIDEILDGEGLVIMEWGSKFPEVIPDNALIINIEDISPSERLIQMNCRNNTIIERINEVLKI